MTFPLSVLVVDRRIGRRSGYDRMRPACRDDELGSCSSRMDVALMEPISTVIGREPLRPLAMQELDFATSEDDRTTTLLAVG